MRNHPLCKARPGWEQRGEKGGAVEGSYFLWILLMESLCCLVWRGQCCYPRHYIQEWVELKGLVATRLGFPFSPFSLPFPKVCLSEGVANTIPLKNERYLKPFTLCSHYIRINGQGFRISCKKKIPCENESFNWKLVFYWYFLVREMCVSYRF